jgi:hypothetical protein
MYQYAFADVTIGGRIAAIFLEYIFSLSIFVLLQMQRRQGAYLFVLYMPSTSPLALPGTDFLGVFNV